VHKSFTGSPLTNSKIGEALEKLFEHHSKPFQSLPYWLIKKWDPEKAMLGLKCLNRACVKRILSLLVPKCLNRRIIYSNRKAKGCEGLNPKGESLQKLFKHHKKHFPGLPYWLIQTWLKPFRNCLNATAKKWDSEKAMLGLKCLNRACVKRIFYLLVPICLNRRIIYSNRKAKGCEALNPKGESLQKLFKHHRKPFPGLPYWLIQTWMKPLRNSLNITTKPFQAHHSD